MSTVNICNRALSKIGTHSQIASLSEASAEARECNLNFDAVRDQLLRAAHWSFARKFENAGVLKYGPGADEFTGSAPSVWSSTYPPPGWNYTYSYPSDCLLVRYVTPQPVATSSSLSTPIFPSDTITYANISPTFQRFAKGLDTDSQGNDIPVIWTNTKQAIFCYTKRVTSTGVWDPMFTDAMVHALAGTVAIALTGKVEVARMMFELANSTIMSARQADANEGLTIMDTVPESIRARGLSWGFSDGVLMSPYGPMFELA